MKQNMNYTSRMYPTSRIYPIDYEFIGNESCNDLQSEFDVVNIDYQKALAPSKEKKITRCLRRNKEKKREFPPPIPYPAQTENYASHMPYVLTRYYTNEGRLIIKEEKAKNLEYFQAHRENGRLTMQLVLLDDNDDDDDDFMGTNEEEEEQEVEEQEEELASVSTSPQDINNVIIDGFEEKEEEENKDNTEKSGVGIGDEDVVENENEIVGGANSSRGNSLNCNSVISAPSGIFGVLPLQPLRIVRG